MNRGSAVFLQVVIALVGLAALAILLGEPHLEGRNAHATLTEIYFHDPFLVCAYIASIPVFVALYHTAKFTGYAGRNRVFAPAAVKSLRAIRRCAIAVIGCAVGFEIYLVASNGSDDRAGGVAIGLLIMFIASVIAAGAALFTRIVQHGVDLQTENDLTV
ncbi:DUF2975 domain-containing protein [Nocardia sp. NPDC056100]|uniref:DUF2975 domain-containing protein n=1 Tax=Nocardia sp. NPDC056100 TaxID=3345712 RepID=UPI0035DC025C